MLRTVRRMMLGRIIILTFLLTITFLFQISDRKYFFIPLTDHFYYFIGFFYLVTIFYSILLGKIRNYLRFTFTQIIVDHLFITGLVYFTGGEESFFPLTYIFCIIGSSIIFYKRGAFFSASLSTLLYGLLLLLQLHHWINPIGHSSSYESGVIFYSLTNYMITFYIVAFLSSVISEELKKKRKELLQKQVDYDQLEAFNRNIIQSLDSGLLTMDLQGRINFLNQTAEKILSWTGKDLKGCSIYHFFPNLTEVIYEAGKISKSISDYHRYETLVTNERGKKAFLGFHISPLTDPEGSLIGHTLIFQDITKIREMEEQIKRGDKMAAIGLLAAGMAHEIRNPLASLSGAIQMLKSELQLDPLQQHLMEITLRESERLNALVTDFLLFAQPPQTHKIPCEIQKIVEETIDLFAHSSSSHEGIHILRPNGHESLRAMIDPNHMKQVFWNLLINAAQAMPKGGEIRIHLERVDETTRETSLISRRNGEKWLKISIADSGNGIDPRQKEKIFEPFFTTKEGGTGLGLSIVHKMIENHNGLIKVESEPGEGSTFTIFLPTDDAIMEC